MAKFKSKSDKSKSKTHVLPNGQIVDDDEILLLEELLQEEMYARCEKSLFQFFINFWNTFDPQPLVNNWHLECLCEHLEAALRREIRRLAICIPPRCLLKGTKVRLWNGTALPIEQLKVGYEAMSWDVEAKLHKPGKITDVINNGKREVFRITLEEGKFVTATKDHRFYTSNGYRTVESLRVGDDISVAQAVTGEEYFPKIVLIESVGIGEVYDITVDKYENFTLSNGIHSHNSSKCLREDTLIRMADGSQKPIKNILPGEYVLSLDTKKGIHKPGKVAEVINSGLKPIYKVVVDTGEEIYSTKEHQFYTWDGYKRLEEMSVGDDVSVARSFEPISTAHLPLPLVRLLALWMAEGHKASGFRITSYDEAINLQAKKDAAALGYGVSEDIPRHLLSVTGKVNRFTLSETITYIYKGVRPTTYNLYIPNEVFRLPESHIIEFLAMWIATDGYIGKKGVVGVSLASEQCVKDLASLFKRLGIRTKINYRERTYTKNGVKSEKTFDSWTLLINGLEDLERFKELFTGKLYQKNEKIKYLNRSKATTTYLPPQYLTLTASYCDSYVKNKVARNNSWGNIHNLKTGKYVKPTPALMEKVTKEESWRRIVSIEYVGYENTYDICVPEYENFTTAEGFHVHNSTTASIAAPIWHHINHPHEKFWLISHSQDLFVQNIGYARKILEHPLYKDRWMNPALEEHYRFSLAKDSNTKTRVDNSAGGYLLGGSPGSGALGKGYTVAILDDILDSRQSNNQEAVEGVNNYYTQTLLNRSNDVKNDVQIIVMQRLNENDLVGYVQKNYPEQDWFVLNLPAKYDPDRTFVSPIGFNDKRSKRNELLDPVRLPDEFLLTQTKDPITYNTRYQQNPEATGDGNFIKAEWLRESDYTPINYSVMITVWDLSITDRPESDYTVGLVMCKFGDEYHIIDMWRKQCEIPEQIDAIKRMKRKYPSSIVGIEARSNGHAAMSMLQRDIQNIYAIEPRKFGGSKEQRLGSVLSYFRDKKVVIYNPFKPDPKLEPTYSAITIQNELKAFPLASHDDIVDCVAYGVSYLAEYGQESTAIITKGQRIIAVEEDYKRNDILNKRVDVYNPLDFGSDDYLPSRDDLSSIDW